MTRFLVLVAWLVSTSLVLAQGAPTAYVLRIYQSGVVVSEVTHPATIAECDLTPITGSSVNPTRWRFDDPARPGRDCEITEPTRLAALADGTYEGAIVATNADGVSPESPRVPFVRRRPQPPNAPTGVRLIP